jgi:hypothetical protein
MHISNGMRWVLRLGTAITLAFIYVPLIVIAIYAFNDSRSQAWPIDGLTLDWFDKAFHNPGVRDALWTSVKAGVGATLIALVLGTLAALAISRYRFFGRDTVSFLIILPIALPGIVTGMALNATFTQVLGSGPVALHGDRGHATFCIVVVFNNAVARLRRSGTSLEEASMDLGANSLAHVPVRDIPDAADRPRGRRPPGLRAVVRRDHRHDVHDRSGADPADLDLHQLRAAESAADRERGRPDGDPPVDHPGVPGEPAVAGPDRDAGRSGAGRRAGSGSGAVGLRHPSQCPSFARSGVGARGDICYNQT